MPGYLTAGASGALFLQWTRSADSLTGTMTAASINTSDPTRIDTNSVSFTGIVSGSSITLTLASGSTWNGTLGSSGLTLSYPTGNDTLSTAQLGAADISAYNTAVRQLQDGANNAATATAEAQVTVQAQSTSTQTAAANAPLYAVLAEVPDNPDAVPIHSMKSGRTDWISLAIEGGSALRSCLTAVRIDVAQLQPDGSFQHIKTYSDPDVCAAPYRSDYFLPTDQNGNAKPGQYRLMITVGDNSIAPYTLVVTS